VAAAAVSDLDADVYEGAPTPVTALFSAGPKAAAFALLLRIFATVPAATHSVLGVWISRCTMFAGNLGALVQTNISGCWPTVQSRTRLHLGCVCRLFDGQGRRRSSGRVSAVLFISQHALVKLRVHDRFSVGGPAKKSLAGHYPGSRSASPSLQEY